MNTILIIEDERGLAQSLSYVLKHAGFETILAASGDEGLRLVQTTKPSLILLDLILPGMSGVEVLKAIQDNPNTRSIPVIVLTNVESSEMISKVIAIQKIDYLVKSNYSLEEIVERVQNKLTEAIPSV